MAITGIVAQLLTTDMASSIRFFTEKLGFSVEFKYSDFCAGIRAGSQIFHLKLVDKKDPSIPYVDEGEHFHLYFETNAISDIAAQLKANGVELVKDVHKTPWNTREIVIHDDQGHALYFGERQ
jgi:catechol 2,3-dioxygenase-like lactoylglutathione lyase family enzyme